MTSKWMSIMFAESANVLQRKGLCCIRIPQIVVLVPWITTSNIARFQMRCSHRPCHGSTLWEGLLQSKGYKTGCQLWQTSSSLEPLVNATWTSSASGGGVPNPPRELSLSTEQKSYTSCQCWQVSEEDWGWWGLCVCVHWWELHAQHPFSEELETIFGHLWQAITPRDFSHPVDPIGWIKVQKICNLLMYSTCLCDGFIWIYN